MDTHKFKVSKIPGGRLYSIGNTVDRPSGYIPQPFKCSVSSTTWDRRLQHARAISDSAR